MRVTTIRAHPTAAAGGVLITQGKTQVLCTASIAKELPRWMQGSSGAPAKGWVTAEYSMLPGSTRDRKSRGADSRATEIQRLIGRSLRAAVDLTKMPGVMITCDCDVLVADGGTRTASITGAFVALSQAVNHARRKGLIEGNPVRGPVAAVSVGIVNGRPQLDLDYRMDSQADVDLNVVMNDRGRYVEVQGTAEQEAFSRRELAAMLSLAASGIRQLIRIQKRAARRSR